MSEHTVASRQVVIGDGRLPYGEIVAVIDAARGAGVTRVGIVTGSMRRPNR